VPASILDRGVSWVLFLQRLSPALDGVMTALTLLGEAAGVLLLVSILYWSLDRRLAARLVLLLVLSLAINSWAKALLDAPRPYQYDPRVIPLDEAAGGGMPSGHTQTAVVIWGMVALWVRKRWTTILAVALMVLVPLSRLYLGVHFPTDLLGGYVLGGLLLWAFVRLEPGVSRWLDRQSVLWRILVTAVLPAALLSTLSGLDPIALPGAAAYFGAALGYHLLWPPVREEVGGTVLQRVLRWVVGVVTVAALAMGAGAVARVARAAVDALAYAAVGLWATLGVPWLFTRLGLARQSPLRRRRSAR